MKAVWTIIIIIVIVLLLLFLGGNGESQNNEEQEKVEEETLVISNVSEDIIGSWVSLDDDKYVVEINEDGSIKESYDSASVEEGTYTLTDSVKGNYGEFGENGVFIIKTLGEEVFNYRILSLEKEVLHMVYLDGTGQTLRFGRLVIDEVESKNDSLEGEKDDSVVDSQES